MYSCLLRHTEQVDERAIIGVCAAVHMEAVEVSVLLAVKKVFHQFYTSFPHASRWVLCLSHTLLYIGRLNRSEAVRFLFHLLPGGVGVEQCGVDIGVARLVCQIGNGVSILQGIGAEEVAEGVRGDGL